MGCSADVQNSPRIRAGGDSKSYPYPVDRHSVRRPARRTDENRTRSDLS